MDIQDLLAQINEKQPLDSDDLIVAFERTIGAALPPDYRSFLQAVNGGHLGGRVCCGGVDARGYPLTDINHIYGFRPEFHFSLEQVRDCYQSDGHSRISKSLLAIMDDSGGNAICIGIAGKYLGKIYFCDHELEPDPDEWDGQIETAGNVRLIADTFDEFVDGCCEPPE